jgi:hypothetical protein
MAKKEKIPKTIKEKKVKKEKKSRKEKNGEQILENREAPVSIFDISKMKITTPAGRPPVELESTLPEHIDEWALAISKTGPYTINAIQYWVRYFHETWSPEYRLICDYLREASPRLKIPYIRHDHSTVEIQNSSAVLDNTFLEDVTL